MDTNLKKCVFAGTFDPITAGHERIINKCLKLFDEVVVAVLVNTAKATLLSLEERTGLLKQLYSDEVRIKIVAFDGAVVDLLEKENTPFYVRGVRNTLDFEYENQNYFANKRLKNDIITLYIPSEQDDLHISSTLVKNSVYFKKQYAEYLPEKIRESEIAILEKKICSKNK